MHEASDGKPHPLKPEPLHQYAPEEVYSETAVWLCKNKKTGYKTRIHGALAQILKKYPHDYKLRLLSIKEPPHEHPAATGE
jgi:hypothetical protein